MSSGLVIVIAIAALAVLGALAFVTTARRTDVRGAGALSGETRQRDDAARQAREAAERVGADAPAPGASLVTAADAEAAGAAARRPAPLVKASDAAPAPWIPPDPEAIGVSRRMFFNRATVALTGTGLGAFAAAGFVAFLWPSASGGFGQNVVVGKLSDIIGSINTDGGFFYAPSARTWITKYPSDALPKARGVYSDNILSGMENAGIVALYQKCPHLGCRVPSCLTSGWFECPCHGSQYNRVGEKKFGPAPRGMDRFPITVDGGGQVTVVTGTIVPGPVIGTNTTGQEAEGPHCSTGGGGHG